MCERRDQTSAPGNLRNLTGNELIADLAGLVAIFGGVAAGIRWGVPRLQAWSKKRGRSRAPARPEDPVSTQEPAAVEKIWPTRSVAATYRGPGGEPFPAGEYHCPRDGRILDLDYPQARGHCAACGRDYELQPQFFGATWR